MFEKIFICDKCKNELQSNDYLLDGGDKVNREENVIYSKLFLIFKSHQ